MMVREHINKISLYERTYNIERTSIFSTPTKVTLQPGTKQSKRISTILKDQILKQKLYRNLSFL